MYTFFIISFIANGAVTQPKCALNDTGLSDYRQFGVCSHRFAYKLYAASFTKQFSSCKCSPFLNFFLFQICLSTCPTPVLMGVYCPNT